MGTRLYPITERADLLERIAGVPEGTSDQLKEIEKLRETMTMMAWHDELSKCPHAERLYDFQLFGWGKLNAEQWRIAQEVCNHEQADIGSTRDPELVTRMLNAVHDEWKQLLGKINLSDLDGVAWN